MAATTERSDIGYAFVTLAAVAGLIFLFQQFGDPDVKFCRSVFSKLVHGRASAGRQIDWEHLQAIGINVGDMYTKFKIERDQQAYQRSFVWNFAEGFRGAGGELGAFTNWRIYDRNADTTTVAADFPLHHKTLLFVVSAAGPRRLEAIQWAAAAAGGRTTAGKVGSTPSSLN